MLQFFCPASNLPMLPVDQDLRGVRLLIFSLTLNLGKLTTGELQTPWLFYKYRQNAHTVQAINKPRDQKKPVVFILRIYLKRKKKMMSRNYKFILMTAAGI